MVGTSFPHRGFIAEVEPSIGSAALGLFSLNPESSEHARSTPALLDSSIAVPLWHTTTWQTTPPASGARGSWDRRCRVCHHAIPDHCHCVCRQSSKVAVWVYEWHKAVILKADIRLSHSLNSSRRGFMSSGFQTPFCRSSAWSSCPTYRKPR